MKEVVRLSCIAATHSIAKKLPDPGLQVSHSTTGGEMCLFAPEVLFNSAEPVPLILDFANVRHVRQRNHDGRLYDK